MKKLLTLLITIMIVIPTAMTAQIANSRQWKGAPYKLSTSTKKGDVNGDGNVSITDVTMLVDAILNGLPQNTDASIYDTNGDGDVTVSDVTTLVSNILEGNGGGDDENQLDLSATTLYMTIRPSGGCQKTVEIASGSGNYTATSSNNSVVTAKITNSTVILTTQNKGEATITVTDTKSGKTATIQVTVVQAYFTCPDDNHPHIIDLGLPSGILWACCNVGASAPEEYGGYYAWGETEEKEVYMMDTWPFLQITPDEWYLNNLWFNLPDDITGTNYDVAHVKWGGHWVMPSTDQFFELVDKCSMSGTLDLENDVHGVRLSTVFFPAAGYKDSYIDYVNGEKTYTTRVQWEGEEGYYWSSDHYSCYVHETIPDDDPLFIPAVSPYPDLHGFYLYISEYGFGAFPLNFTDDSNWPWTGHGLSVRPVWVP